MSRILVIGMVGNSVFLPVDEFHKGGETIKAKSLHTEPGGKGFNQAIAARRFGSNVTFMAALGNDGYKKVVEEFLNKEKIESVLIEKAGNSAYACITTDSKGTNHVTEYIGVELTKEDVLNNKDKILEADILLLNNEVPEEVNVEAVKIAKENGIKVIMNPAPQRDLPLIIKDNVFLFTPNEHEVVGLEDKDNVIITMGNKGCYIKQLNKMVPAIKVKPVDTTGAGDTFNGVFVSIFLKNNDIEKSVIIANKAAGISTTKNGVVNSIPYSNEIL